MRRVWVAVALMMAIEAAHAQWTPVTAKMRESVEITDNGKQVRVETKEGEYYRSSDGSVLRRWTRINGSNTNNMVGYLNDNRKVLNYQVQYANHQAIERVPSSRTALLPGMMKAETLKKIRDDSVAGFPCTQVPLSVSWRGAPAESAGQACVSAEYDLIVRMESSGKGQDGKNYKQVTELFEIQLGVEPNPGLFDLTGFKILTAAK